MEERERNTKREQEDKIRCANYLLQMFEKYGAAVMEEVEREKAENENKA